MSTSQIIDLGKGHTALIDEEDYSRASKFNWHREKGTQTYYAQRNVYGPKKTTQRLHRFIMNALPGEQVDHINGDGLDNRKKNLRITDSQGNNRNRRKLRPASSRYKGVWKDKQTGRWAVTLYLKDGRRTTRRFNTEALAAIAYDNNAVEVFGEYANLNF